MALFIGIGHIFDYLYRILQRKSVSLQRNDTLHTTAQATAMAQKPLRVCANLLQQQTAGDRFLLADADRICIVLSDFKLHLLLQ
jgi:hypothetical protein